MLLFKLNIKWSESEVNWSFSSLPKICDNNSPADEIKYPRLPLFENRPSLLTFPVCHVNVGGGCKLTLQIKSHWCFMHFSSAGSLTLHRHASFDRDQQIWDVMKTYPCLKLNTGQNRFSSNNISTTREKKCSRISVRWCALALKKKSSSHFSCPHMYGQVT